MRPRLGSPAGSAGGAWRLPLGCAPAPFPREGPAPRRPRSECGLPASSHQACGAGPCVREGVALLECMFEKKRRNFWGKMKMEKVSIFLFVEISVNKIRRGDHAF